MKSAPINPDDVSWGMSGSTSATSGNFNRSTHDRFVRVFCIHKPTGIDASAEFGPARLTKTQWKRKKDELRIKAMADLETAVAKAARK